MLNNRLGSRYVLKPTLPVSGDTPTMQFSRTLLSKSTQLCLGRNSPSQKDMLALFLKASFSLLYHVFNNINILIIKLYYYLY